MSGAAPVEVRIINPKEDQKIVKFSPTHETNEGQWRRGIVEEAKKIVPLFKPDHAIPGVKPIPDSEALRQVNAVRVDAEPMTDITGEDLKYTLNTAISGDINTLTRAAPGKKILPVFLERVRKKAA